MTVTDRLILRNWRPEDAVPFHAMFQDRRVMAHLGPPETLDTVQAMVARITRQIEETGHGFWAVERRSDGRFIGFCGIKPGPAHTPIEDRPEIGWRLAQDCWGQGYASEAARACIAWVWDRLPQDDSVWAITVPANTRSRALMERLGMARQARLDFDHPHLADGSPLIRHITYRLGRPQ